MKVKIKYAIAFFFAIIFTANAQKKDENIGTEVVNVVKPYTPTISDAFKVKETPALEDEDNTKISAIKYNIFSFPVASTFTPSKGRAANVDKTAQERLFKNYATLGLGNYSTINAELFVTENITENSYIGGMFRNLSSGGGIKEVELEDGFNNTSLDLTYGNKTQALSWNVDLGYQNQRYNWYGLPSDFGSALTDEDREAVINGISPEHTYHNFHAGSTLAFNESIFDEVSVKYNRFWDSYDSQENRFYAKPRFSFEINSTKIKTDVIVDYVGGSFENGFDFNPLKYGFANLGIQPSFAMVRDGWSFNIGAAAYYSMDIENDDSKFFIYPQISASFKVVGDLMIFYAGAEGSLEQNSYRDFTNENQFLSPNLAIAPTDRQYDIFAGLKGKLANSVGYNLRGSYVNESGKALFKANDYAEATSDNYEFGNSFGVVYDDVKTVSFFGELKADFTKNIAFGVNGTFSSYSTDVQAEAWNLPEIKIGSSLDVNITQKWYAGADVFYVGERKDQQTNLDAISPAGIATLEGYFDANAHVGYKHNERLTGFLKLNNIANQNYEKWLNYPVQGFQVILGASYKFDF